MWGWNIAVGNSEFAYTIDYMLKILLHLQVAVWKAMTEYFLLFPVTIPGFSIQISTLKQAKKKLKNRTER
jgi:hypothetical protein